MMLELNIRFSCNSRTVFYSNRLSEDCALTLKPPVMMLFQLPSLLVIFPC